MDSEFLFEPPQYNRKMLFHIYNSTLALIQKMIKKNLLNDQEKKDVENIPSILMICYLNGFDEAKQKLIDAKLVLKQYENPEVYIAFKEALRVLRKMKYNKNE
jgi:hypothetical protein